MSTLLALDTSTEACSVALLHEGRVLSHYEVIPRLHAQRLLPMVRDLLDEAGVRSFRGGRHRLRARPGRLHRRAHRHRRGPGPGLRPRQRPVLAVSDLAILAQRAHREQGVERVAAAIDARMDEVYWGCYRLQQGEMRLAGVEAVLPPEQVALPGEAADADWFGAGTGWGYAGRMPVQPAAFDASLLPHAEDLLGLAGFAWARGEGVDAEQALPVYLRDNVATPKKAP
ncbi:putative protease with chaperone activity [Pseudomonas aeruginosa]|nr:tRNA (adenosine(37)-N6)-threonylcarbamoyltransferase complex dimerization subunit type 1 TsaB [Pseudomonas aeruginosa]VFT19124.1 putative protease with chaperone activity [Pseudomonas aeruginosa]